ncbi:component of the polarisome [Linnemannia hyalina]|uniref:Component of the polarisome n=1 Tax=Linnemannia hyalina TaxID=64524 RepID=A0A9P7XMU4_9FUNG|nr:component of the polarisome [Linnemannia hyalina]
MNQQKQGQWQPQAQPIYNQQQQQQQQQQGYAPQRPLHPSVSASPSSLSAGGRSNSPQPSSPISPSMHINTSKVGGSPASQQRSNPSSPAVGSAGNAMEIAARHYESLQQYLLAHILKEKHGVSEQRIAAREKLSRLQQNQLQDLSTDVYDELKRRTDGAQVPFLAVQNDFHPKRNQARQKLATLPQNRFKDLASDVYVQLERQFPTLLEMFPLKALEEKEFLSQSPAPAPQLVQQEREAPTPAVQQSSVVPNMATFTIQDSSNVEEETYYRSPGQQAPASPTALEGNVNFASLDSLMTDIGHIVGKDGSDASKSASVGGNNKISDKKADANELMRLPKDQEPRSPLNGLGIDSGSQLTDHMKQEYETRISALCKRLQHLESEVGEGANRPEGSRLSQVERQLAKQTELYNEQASQVTKLQLDYNKVFNDYHAQLETVDMVNQEVKSLVMDNKNLKQRHLDAEEELQLAYNRIKQLEDENSDLKGDLEDALHREKVAKEEAGARAVVRENTLSAATPVPPTNAININTMDHMSSHHDAPRSDDVDLDTKNRDDDDDDDDDWNQGRQQVRDSILVNPNSIVHQDSLATFRNAVDDLLSAGRSDSSSSVLLGMKSVVIACKTVTEDVEDYEHETNDKHIFADLKQELSSGLTQLMNSAKAHSNAFDEDEDEFDRSLNDLEAAADQLEAIVMDIVNVPKHNGGPIKENGHHGRDHHDDDIQHNNGMSNHDGHHGEPNGNAPAHNGNSNNNNNNNNNDGGPMDSQDLKIYLETQTGLIVSSIQILLRSLRSSSDSEGISDASDDITKVVDQVIRQTRMTLATPNLVSAPQATELRSQGEMVLEDLENSVDLLIEIKEQLEAEPDLAHSSSAEAKSLKQKMASASFDIAKYAKELVSLIED